MIENTDYNSYTHEKRKYQIPFVRYLISPRYFYENLGDANIQGHFLMIW